MNPIKLLHKGISELNWDDIKEAYTSLTGEDAPGINTVPDKKGKKGKTSKTIKKTTKVKTTKRPKTKVSITEELVVDINSIKDAGKWNDPQTAPLGGLRKQAQVTNHLSDENAKEQALELQDRVKKNSMPKQKRSAYIPFPIDCPLCRTSFDAAKEASYKNSGQTYVICPNSDCRHKMAAIQRKK